MAKTKDGESNLCARVKKQCAFVWKRLEASRDFVR